MAHQTAAELSAARRTGLVPVRTGFVPATRSVSMVPAVQMPLGTLLGVGGVTFAVLGLAMVTAGAPWVGWILVAGGLGSALGARLRRQDDAEPAQDPVAPQVSPQVRTERARRVLAALDELGAPTFEMLLHRLRWTESALLGTLVDMKESGLLDEDLDLDSGQWIYRPLGGGETDAVTMTLEQRRAAAEHG